MELYGCLWMNGTGAEAGVDAEVEAAEVEEEVDPEGEVEVGEAEAEAEVRSSWAPKVEMVNVKKDVPLENI